MTRDNPLTRWLEPPARFIAIISGWWLLGLAFLTCAEIACRKFFNISMQGVDEIGAYTLAVFSALSFAYALVVKSHTRVDFLLGHLPGPLRALLNMVAYVSLAGLAVFAAYRSWRRASSSRAMRIRRWARRCGCRKASGCWALLPSPWWRWPSPDTQCC